MLLKFVGYNVRVTADDFVSIYDILKIAGVDRKSTHIWNEIKDQFPINVWKMHKFPTRGFNITPVIKNREIIKLLNLLEGEETNEIIAEISNVIVKVLAGDVNLIQATHKNHQCAHNPSLTDKLMPNNAKLSDLQKNENDLKESRVALLKEENRKRHLMELEKYWSKATKMTKRTKNKVRIDDSKDPFATSNKRCKIPK